MLERSKKLGCSFKLSHTGETKQTLSDSLLCLLDVFSFVFMFQGTVQFLPSSNQCCFSLTRRLPKETLQRNSELLINWHLSSILMRYFSSFGIDIMSLSGKQPRAQMRGKTTSNDSEERPTKSDNTVEKQTNSS